MNDMPVKAVLIDLCRRARQEERVMVNDLSPVERDEIGTPERMSAKDLIAHLTAARGRDARKLAAAQSGDTRQSFDDQEDHHIFTNQQSRSWDDVQDEAEHVFTEFMTQIESLTERELTDLQPDPCEDERPLWEQLTFPGIWHPYSELTRFYEARDKVRRAIEIQESLIGAIEELHAPPMIEATARYNLACVYAGAGKGSEALELLSLALNQDPRLLEYLRDDHDLASLRDEAAFGEIKQRAGSALS